MATLLNQEKKPAIPKLAQDLIAGTVGGWAQVVVGQPLDTIKVRIQTQPSPPIYRNATDCFQQLIRTEGVKRKERVEWVNTCRGTHVILSRKVSIVVSCPLWQVLGFGKWQQVCIVIANLLFLSSNAVMFMSNGYFRRLLQNGDSKKVLSIGMWKGTPRTEKMDTDVYA